MLKHTWHAFSWLVACVDQRQIDVDQRAADGATIHPDEGIDTYGLRSRR